MQLGRAVFAGVAGALAMTVVSLVFGEWGIDVSLSDMLGTFLGFEPGSNAGWLAGFMAHLAVGSWFAVIYVHGFEGLIGRAGWCMGAAFSMVHTVAAGFVVTLLPMVLPQATSQPGMFMAHEGLAGVCLFMLLHLVYGAVVGSVYAFLLTPLYRSRNVLV